KVPPGPAPRPGSRGGGRTDPLPGGPVGITNAAHSFCCAPHYAGTAFLPRPGFVANVGGPGTPASAPEDLAEGGVPDQEIMIYGVEIDKAAAPGAAGQAFFQVADRLAENRLGQGVVEIEIVVIVVAGKGGRVALEGVA